MSAANFYASVRSTIAAGPGNFIKPSSDFVRDRDKLAVGGSLHTFSGLVLDVQPDSNVTRLLVGFELAFFHRLDLATETEDGWFHSNAVDRMPALQALYLPKSWWPANVVDVYEAVEMTASQSDQDRVGDVVSFAINGIVRVNP